MSRTHDEHVAVTSGSEGRWFGMTPAAFLLHSGAQPAARCVMTSLCLYSDHTGRTTALSQIAIANAAGVSRETVTRCIAWLEDEGWIDVYEPVTGRDHRGRMPLRIYSVAPAWRRERERFAEENAPRMKPRKKASTGDDRSPGCDDRSPVTTDHRCAEITGPVTTDHRTGDDRSQRTERETEKAAAAAATTTTVDQVIEAFNDLTGGSWTAAPFRGRIDAVMTAHPELTVDDHRRIIHRQLTAPWWTGPARPNHVYRDLEQFERCLADAAQAAPAAAAPEPADGLERWERDAIQAYRNTGVDGHLGEIDAVGSPAARNAAAAARAAHQVVAA